MNAGAKNDRFGGSWTRKTLMDTLPSCVHKKIHPQTKDERGKWCETANKQQKKEKKKKEKKMSKWNEYESMKILHIIKRKVMKIVHLSFLYSSSSLYKHCISVITSSDLKFGFIPEILVYFHYTFRLHSWLYEMMFYSRIKHQIHTAFWC